MVVDAFYSDPHFGHDKIRLPTHADRPFDSVEEMNAQLVERYNAVIGTSDTVLWLGDAFWKVSRRYRDIMASLHGRKLLIMGNHDPSTTKMAKMGFSLVMNEAVMFIAGRVCRVNHYPYAYSGATREDDRYLDRRPPKRKGEVLIHGHTHAKRKLDGNMIHVGVDAWGFRPVLFSEVEEMVRKHFPVKS